MPNWCENCLEVCAPDAAQACAFIHSNCEEEDIALPNDCRLAFVMSRLPHLATGCAPSLPKIPPELIKQIFALAHTTKIKRNLSFAKSVPKPPHWNGAQRFGSIGPQEESVYGNDTWYSFNTREWGTKWEPAEVHVSFEGKGEDLLDRDGRQTLTYSFETAWSPPAEWLQKVAKMCFHLSTHTPSAILRLPSRPAWHSLPACST